MTRAQAEGTSANSIPPDSSTAQTRAPAAPHALQSPKASVDGEESFLSLLDKEGLCEVPTFALTCSALGQMCAQREHDAPHPTGPTAFPLADSKQSTFTLKQPTSHNLICHFLQQKWSSFLWHPDNVNEMENTPSGSYHAEQNQEKDISRGRLSTFLWAAETSLIMLDTLCSTSP